MSDMHLTEAQRNDAAECAPGLEPDALRAHLDACVECARDVEGLRALLAEARVLAAPVQPQRDLWSGIQARIRGGGNEIAFPRPAPVAPERRAVWPPALRAAAAVALLLTGAAAGVIIARTAGPSAGPLAEAPVRGELTPVTDVREAVSGEYANPLAQLETELDRRRADLPPETVAEIERNLAIIDGAIGAALRAFDEAPGDPVLPQMLHRAYGRKVELLEQAVSLPRTI